MEYLKNSGLETMASHLDGLEQIETSGFYRIANKFLAVCHSFNDARGQIVHVINNDQQFLGVAYQRRDNGVICNWSWVSATGDGTSSAHISGPHQELRMVEGHLLPPIDTPKWSQEPAAPAAGMTSMLVTEREKAAILAFRGSAPDQIAVSFYPS